MSRIQRDVRDMLHRRSLDIVGDEARGVASRAPATETKRIAAAAAVAIGLGAFAWMVVADADDPVDLSTDPAPTIPSATEPTPTTTGPSPEPADAEGIHGAPPPSPTSWRDLLPRGFVPETAMSIFREEPAPGSGSPAELATVHSTVDAYLADRAPLLIAPSGARPPAVYTTIEDTGRLAAVHYAVPVDARWEHGVVVVRTDFDAHYSVVAAVSANVGITDVQRNAVGVVGLVRSEGLDLLAADVLDLDRVPVPTAPHPEGLTGIEPVFATAGSVQPSRPGEAAPTLELDIPVDPSDGRPVIVLLRHVGGTWLSITEFALRPTAYSSSCPGSQAPVDVNFGPWFSTIAGGSLPGSHWPLVDNQSRSHLIGEHASVEMFWPPNPEWLDTVARSGPAEPQGVSAYFAVGETALLGTGTDPCDYVQLSFTGEPIVVERWTSAVSSMYSFGVPVSLADFGPEQMLAEAAVSDDFGDAAGNEASEDLVVAVEEAAAELPSVPPTGSCDGLPDSPPRVGQGQSSWTTSPRAALEALLVEQTLQLEAEQIDVIFPTTGFIELTNDGDVVAYVLRSTDLVTGVVEIQTDGSRWRVSRWESSAC